MTEWFDLGYSYEDAMRMDGFMGEFGFFPEDEETEEMYIEAHRKAYYQEFLFYMRENGEEIFSF